MFGKKKSKGTKADVRNVKAGFAVYTGYIPELSLFSATDGRWFKVYKVSYEGFHPSIVHDLLDYDGFHMQLICEKDVVLLVASTEADTPEDAVVAFSRLEGSLPHKAISAEEWFEYMSQRLRNEPFAGLPDPKKRKETAISKIQPYNVKASQTEMEISGKVSRTVLLIGYPSALDGSFASEMLCISKDITLCVHSDRIDVEQCLLGLDYTKDIRPARRDAMRMRLERARECGESLFDICVLVNFCGDPDSVEQDMKKFRSLCEKYFINYSALDFQQEMAFKSTLPLLNNQVRYNRVLGQDFLTALMPWSELSARKKSVSYGIDPAFGEVLYDRRVGGEYGLILASDHRWAMARAAQEIEAYRADGDLMKFYVLADEDADLSVFGEWAETDETNYHNMAVAHASAALQEKFLTRWAETYLSTNGQLMKKHRDMISKAAKGIQGDKLDDRLSSFTAGFGENEKRVLGAHPFPMTVPVITKDCGHTLFVQAKGNRLEREIGYSLAFEKADGKVQVYSVNTELLLFQGEPAFGEGQYTLLTATPRQTYEHPYMKDLLADFPFALIGEHRVADKLDLCGHMMLTKKQRAWISTPANGSVLIAQHGTYLLTNRKEDIVNGCEA